MKQNFEELLKIYKKNLINEPNNEILLYNIGVINFLQKDFENAQKNLKKAIELGFEGDNARIGSMFYQMGNYKESLKVYEKALKNFSNEENLYICLSEIYKKINDKKNAIKILKSGIKVLKNNTKIHYFLGNIYFEEKEYKKAISEYKKIDNKTCENFLSIANAYVMLDDIKKAIQNYKKAYELTPTDSCVMNLYNDALNEFFRRKNDQCISK